MCCTNSDGGPPKGFCPKICRYRRSSSRAYFSIAPSFRYARATHLVPRFFLTMLLCISNSSSVSCSISRWKQTIVSEWKFWVSLFLVSWREEAWKQKHPVIIAFQWDQMVKLWQSKKGIKEIKFFVLMQKHLLSLRQDFFVKAQLRFPLCLSQPLALPLRFVSFFAVVSSDFPLNDTSSFIFFRGLDTSYTIFFVVGGTTSNSVMTFSLNNSFFSHKRGL